MSWMTWLDEWLFPNCCPVCMDVVEPRGALVCDLCKGKLQRIQAPYCIQCGKQLAKEEEEYCFFCRKVKRSFVRGIAGWNYESVPIRQMIAEVKYHNKRQLLDYPCNEMADYFFELVKSWKLQCLIPVPLHWTKQRQRGFNQAEEIAKRLGKKWEIPLEKKLLRREKRTHPQKELDEMARMKNLLEAFCVDEERLKKFRPHTVGIVDDIYTTGSTMEACTRILYKNGIKNVYSIALTAVS